MKQLDALGALKKAGFKGRSTKGAPPDPVTGLPGYERREVKRRQLGKKLLRKQRRRRHTPGYIPGRGDTFKQRA